MKAALSKIWTLFWSAVPAWVVKLQLVTGAVAAYGVTVAATHWTGGLLFLNSIAPEMITFGTVATIALQFIQKVETVFMAPGDTLTNAAEAPVAVDVPTEQAGGVTVDPPAGETP